MKEIVVYPGRFQPMLRHHAAVYHQLQQQFPRAQIFFGTSDKVEPPNSPFNFKEKQLIAHLHDIPMDRVLMVRRPYEPQDYALYFDPTSTVLIFAVGEKDLMRFPFDNTDPKTGLDMTVRGIPRPRYHQRIATMRMGVLPMKDRGYITLAPTITDHGKVASASEFRNQFRQAPDVDAAKKVFRSFFAKYDESAFNLLYTKLKDPNMASKISEMNQLRKLAGLPLMEAAPVEFKPKTKPSDAKFVAPTDGSSRMSIANRFQQYTQNGDLADPNTRLELFQKALVREPGALLAEINGRLDPKDSNSLNLSDKLSIIFRMLERSPNGSIADLPPPAKDFVIKLVAAAAANMELTSKSDIDLDEPEDDSDEFASAVVPSSPKKKGKLTDSVTEGVTIKHDRYINAHGRKPKGGQGAWKFTTKRSGQPGREHVFSCPGDYREVATKAKKWARENGHNEIFVMEGCISNDDINAPIPNIALASLTKKFRIVEAVDASNETGAIFSADPETARAAIAKLNAIIKRPLGAALARRTVEPLVNSPSLTAIIDSISRKDPEGDIHRYPEFLQELTRLQRDAAARLHGNHLAYNDTTTAPTATMEHSDQDDHPDHAIPEPPSQEHELEAHPTHKAHNDALNARNNHDESVDDEFDEFDDDSGESDNFYVAMVSNRGSTDCVVHIHKNNGKWIEDTVPGYEAPYNWPGGNYMSYLTSSDIMSWLDRDYGRYYEILGPYDSLEQAAAEVTPTGMR